MTNNEKELILSCGQTKLELEMAQCSQSSSIKNRNNQKCVRNFNLYIPKYLCQTKDEGALSNNGIIQQKDRIPLVFALHCFGCKAEVMGHWIDIAEKFQFALVLPEGMRNSWNARYCCGYALENDIDDYGFMNGIIQMLIPTDVSKETKGIHEYKTLHHSLFSKDALYAVGWSNGGYMVTYAADLFRGIAPIAGHQYNVMDFPKNPTSIFMHHGSDDTFVRPTGCCKDPSFDQCCCGISMQAQECTNVMEVFDQWAKQVNRCTKNTNTNGKIKNIHDETNDAIRDIQSEMQQVETDIHHIYKQSDGIHVHQNSNITCFLAKGACEAHTEYCIHDKKGHFNRPSLEKAFPMMDDIAHFFAKDACSINHGIWSKSLRKCTCSTKKSHNMIGTYCLLPSNHKSQDSNYSSSSFALIEIGAAWFSAFGIVILFVVLSLLRPRQNRYQYEHGVQHGSDNISLELSPQKR